MEVEFAGGLRGRLYVPDGEGPFAAVAMAHGFSATIGMGVTAWAERLCDAGYVALAYDHRHLGASDGEPRGLVDWALQARDLVEAIDFLAARPEVDPDRLATWGSSYSGAQGAWVAARRLRSHAISPYPHRRRPRQRALILIPRCPPC